MSAPDYEIEWNGEDGTECPECGALCRSGEKWFTDVEYATLIDCTECSFIIEGETNLVYQNRIERMRERTEADLTRRDI